MFITINFKLKDNPCGIKGFSNISLKALIGIIVIVVFSTACSYLQKTAYCSQNIVQKNLYSNTKFEFSIVFPDGWSVVQNDSLNYVVVAEDISGPKISINVEYTDPKYTADMLSIKDTEYIVYELRNTFPDIALMKSSEKTISNRKALMIKCNYTIFAVRMTMSQFIMIKEGKIFTITCTATLDQYDRYEAAFINSVSTFVLKGTSVATTEHEEHKPVEQPIEIPEINLEDEMEEVEEVQEKEVMVVQEEEEEEQKPESHYDEIAKAHPDYQEIAQSSKFMEYIDNMPLQQRKSVEHIIESGSVEEVIKLLSDYKKYVSRPKIVETPIPETYIEDRADIIDKQTESTLNTYLKILARKTNTLMIVLTVKTTGGTPIKQYVRSFADKWERNQSGGRSHVFIVVAVSDGKYSIKVSKDMKSLLPNNFCLNIGKTLFVPSFRIGNYSQGVYQGVVAMSNEISKSKKAKIHAIGDKVILHNSSDEIVEIYKDATLEDSIILFTNGIEGTIVDVKTSDKFNVLYKVKVWDYVGWISEDSILD